jgi:hypothetical protein
MINDTKTLDWLLEPADPGVRYLALRDLLHLPADDADLRAARVDAHTRGPIARVLEGMHPEGWWEKPGTGYGPKYRSTVWALILLGQLGAYAAEDVRVEISCRYYLDNALTPGGQLSAMASGAPSGTADCLQGNMLRALLDLGCDDPRLDAAFEWMARSVTGEGVAPRGDKNAALRYYGGKCGPDFACGSNYGYPCAWGAVKVMMAFAALPPARRTPLIERAIQRGLEFLFSVELTSAKWPARQYIDHALTTYDTYGNPAPGSAEYKPSGNWWKFGFPVFYVTDLLQAAEALVGLGCADDPRVQPLLAYIESKRDAQGRWALEYDYAAKTWGSFGEKRQPNKWVTLRALRVLKLRGA